MSPHFSLAELTVTTTGLPNIPDAVSRGNLARLAEALELVRAALGGRAMLISSAYRSPSVNAAVGGRATSAHMVGLAADFTCPSFGSPLDVCITIAAAGLEFDQLIHEYGRWVHLGIGGRRRRQMLTIDRLGVRQGLLEIRK